MIAFESVDGLERGGSEVAGGAKHVSRQNFLGIVNNNHTTLLSAMLTIHYPRTCIDDSIDKHVDPASYAFSLLSFTCTDISTSQRSKGENG
jgi:hypothetical protein